MAAKSLCGKVFDRLIVIERSGTDKWGNALWKCKCTCGGETVVKTSNLNARAVRSCGCMKGESAITHGGSYTRLYHIWYGIIRRTEDPTRKEYKDYGGRGIRMCPEWRSSFETFRDWALDNGYSDESSIDRSDNGGNYEPSNCTWESRLHQANNRTDTCYITFGGVTKSASSWARETGIPYLRIKKRLRLGWSPERILA